MLDVLKDKEVVGLKSPEDLKEIVLGERQLFRVQWLGNLIVLGRSDEEAQAQR